MTKKQWVRYTHKILNGNNSNGDNHLKIDKVIGTLFLNYNDDRRRELTNKVNRLSVTDQRTLEDFLDYLIGLIAGGETVIMSLNAYAKDTSINPERLKRLTRTITDKYVRGVISKHNSSYGDLK